MAEGQGFTGMPYSTYGVTPAATVPAMATTVSERVASSSTFNRESMPCRYDDDCVHDWYTWLCRARAWLYHASPCFHLSEWPTWPSGLCCKEQRISKILKQVPDAVGDTRSSL